jgi:LacI family transcriptional regulator
MNDFSPCRDTLHWLNHMERTPSKPNSQVTQADVAHRAGVSRSIVSYVINNGPRPVSPETRARVLKAIEELGYRPNKYAQMLIRQQATSVTEKYFGIVLADVEMFRRPYYGSILASIHEHAHAQNAHIRFMRVFRDLKNPLLLNELIHPEEISGLILLGVDQVLSTEEDHRLLEQILSRISSAVTVEWRWDGVPSIQFDRQEAGHKAARHLIGLGHTRLAYIGQSDTRLNGFQQALWESGLAVEPPLVLSDAENAQKGYERCLKIMQMPDLPTAFMAGSDEVAFGVLKGLHDHGIKVPEQIALVSIDDIDLSAFVSPGLTTVHVPKEDMGFYAVQVLVNVSAQPETPPAAIVLPTSLTIRESCGARS